MVIVCNRVIVAHTAMWLVSHATQRIPTGITFTRWQELFRAYVLTLTGMLAVMSYNYYTSSKILTDFQHFCTAKKRMKFTTKPVRHTHLTLGMLLHYLWRLKIRIFCRYLAYPEENAISLHRF